MKRVAICKQCKQRIVWREEHYEWCTADYSTFTCGDKNTTKKIAWDHQPIVFKDYLDEVEKLNTK